MPDTVTAADIARLAGVGRAAVSNWRRRHPDFPRPVGGTATSPQFALREVEDWLRAQGKLRQVPPAERAWQQVRSRADDTGLGETLAEAGEMLLNQATDPAFAAVTELAAERGAVEAYEFLLGRFLEVQPRRIGPTPAAVAELMADLLDPGTTSVLDPACGAGTLLVRALARRSPQRLLGQEQDGALARLARIRLALRGPGAEIAAGDSLRADGFAGTTVDAVLCDPPFNERHWGYEELTTDVRWEYGLPPRMEPELAWVQHALAHLAPGGLAVVAMPPAAAGRRSGRRIRAQLLRRGALRAVVALPGSAQLWLLRRPGAEPGPSTVLMVEGGDAAQITAAWRDFQSDPELDRPGVGRAVPLIDLLDEDVDVTPGRHLPAGGTERTAERFLQTRARLAGTLERMAALLPAARPAERAQDVPVVPLSELVRAGALTVRQAPLRREPATAGTGVPLLTAQDVIEGREPSAHVPPDLLDDGERWIIAEEGDVVVTAAARSLAARVVERGGAVLGPYLVLVRADPDLLDPHYLAGILRSSANVRQSTAVSSGSRIGIRRALVPRLPVEEQRRLGALFRRMDELAAALRAGADLGGELARLLADGIAEGALGPDRD
ncbi:N-6 DNA methylase [Thermomonospora cellulosilytica]|uniref:16S rRNA G966 N2-methylase RsmD n=1 Tax=Thermomonospora cellulosilytica TaxID=1411118 RepID=A0A7W3R888_9ACTN|nr:N-6 DNA methylase [Thermomonospora cellulosilytica]MBA9003422.1 16S rRNA G966 N2-methylase RsmD [Thermomonospora cellulosilytica]